MNKFTKSFIQNSFQKYSLKPADRIIVPKSELRWVQHHAIYIGQDSNGLHWVIENKEGKSVRLITLDEFLKDVIEITQIIPFTGNEVERQQAIQRAMVRLGTSYDLVNYNCEHFASEVQHGKAESKQIDKVGKGILLAGLLWIIASIVE